MTTLSSYKYSSLLLVNCQVFNFNALKLHSVVLRWLLNHLLNFLEFSLDFHSEMDGFHSNTTLCICSFRLIVESFIEWRIGIFHWVFTCYTMEWTNIDYECEGLLATAYLMDKVGRKKTQCIDFAVSGVFAFLLMICSGRTIETAFLFVARAGIAGAFQATYVYTPGIPIFY